MYLTVAFVIFAIWLVIKCLEWKRNTYDPVKKIPSIGYLIIGGLHRIIGVPKKDLFKTAFEMNMKGGPVFRNWIGLTPVIEIMKPEYVEVITNNTVQIDKGFIYDAFRPWLGESLFLSTGAKWHNQRKLITPTFHFKILENFVVVFAEKAEILLKNLDEKGDGQPFDIYPEVTLCALDIICETAMGVKINAMSNKDNEYVRCIHEISSLIMWRWMRSFLPDFICNFFPQSRRFKEVIDTLHGFTKKVINERKELLKNKPKEISMENSADDEVLGKKKRISFLDLLLEVSQDGNYLSDNDIREQVDTLLFAGHDTTTASICWALLLLGNHPDIQEKAYEEIHNVLETKNTPTTISELNDLKYLECVIKEALRMYPSVLGFVRRLKQEVEIEGCKIAAGMEVVIHIYELHHSPEHFPNPEKFLPERFFPENSVNRHPYAYIPFSAGPRNCIGQKFAMNEEKIILASIINRYKITAMESQEEAVIAGDVILRPMNGINLKLERRK